MRRIQAVRWAAPVLLLYVLESLARGSAIAFFPWLWQNPLPFLLNLAFLSGLCLLGFSFRSYKARGLWLCGLGLFCTVYGEICRYKLQYRLEPVLWSDVSQLHDAMAAVGGSTFAIRLWPVALPLGLFLAGAVCCCLFVKGRARRRNAAPACLGLLLAAGAALLCTFSLLGSETRYDLADHARRDGCLYTAFAMENQRRATVPPRYTRESAEEAYRSLGPAKAAATGDDPNVIVVLSEAFSDESMWQGALDFTAPVTPFFEKLKDECLSGLLYVPKIGGGTSETEFEVLTGMRSRYAANPYSMGLPPIRSLAALCKERGYTATALHWYAGVYYNRYHNLKMEGFDAFYTTDVVKRDFEKIGMFVSDREHYQAVNETLTQTPGRDFVFCLTMQNHGGYAYDDFRQAYGATAPFSNALSEESALVLANYFYLLKQSDDALAEWISALRDWPEPVVVVFFGDHLPALGAEVYAELGLSLSGDAAYQTPYFVWSNRQALSGERNLYAYQLGAMALCEAGLGGDPFFDHVEGLRQSGAQEDEAYDLLCYDALFGQQYAYQCAGLHPESQLFQIGGPMTLSGFDAALADGQAVLKPRLNRDDLNAVLCLNGETLLPSGALPQTDGPFSLSCALVAPDGSFYNQSNSLVYESVDDLLKKSGALASTAHPLAGQSFSILRNRWYQSYLVAVSQPGAAPAGLTALSVNGQPFSWQYSYGLRQAGQYAVDGEGRVYVAIAKNALSQLTEKGVAEYLENGVVYGFEN